MNPTLLRFLMTTLLQNKASDLTPEQASPALWRGPEEAMAGFDSAVDHNARKTPMDHISEAFRQLKDMHKDPALEQAMASRQQPGQMAQANPFQGLF